MYIIIYMYKEIQQSPTMSEKSTKRGRERTHVPEMDTHPEKKAHTGPARSLSPGYVPSFEGDGWTPTQKRLRLPNGRFATPEQSVFDFCQRRQDRGY